MLDLLFLITFFYSFFIQFKTRIKIFIYTPIYLDPKKEKEIKYINWNWRNASEFLKNFITRYIQFKMLVTLNSAL